MKIFWWWFYLLFACICLCHNFMNAVFLVSNCLKQCEKSMQITKSNNITEKAHLHFTEKYFIKSANLNETVQINKNIQHNHMYQRDSTPIIWIHKNDAQFKIATNSTKATGNLLLRCRIKLAIETLKKAKLYLRFQRWFAAKNNTQWEYE